MSLRIRAAVDWGSSNFRAYCFDNHGALTDSFSSASGIKTIKENQGFEATLQECIGHWLSPGDTVLLSGMITSRNGWRESEYLSTPANLEQLLHYSLKARHNDVELLFLPGVCQSEPADVMRGEELQLLGASSATGWMVCVLPGTHSKWVLMQNRSVQTFRTIPTGEIFDLLLNHSLIGALSSDSQWSDEYFETGVHRGFNHSTIISDLFTTRSSVLLNQCSGAQSYAWLSGLLIGNEVREAKSMMQESGVDVNGGFNGSVDVAVDVDVDVGVIGAGPLARHYVRALNILGIGNTQFDADVAIDGYQQIIRSSQ